MRPGSFSFAQKQNDRISNVEAEGLPGQKKSALQSQRSDIWCPFVWYMRKYPLWICSFTINSLACILHFGMYTAGNLTKTGSWVGHMDFASWQRSFHESLSRSQFFLETKYQCCNVFARSWIIKYFHVFRSRNLIERI